MSKLNRFIFAFFIVLYLAAEGTTEGYTWASQSQKQSNLIICGNYGKGATAKIDYHTWRLFEIIGIFGMAIMAMKTYNRFKATMFLFGISLFGFMLYDSILHYICSGDFFYRPEYFNIVGLNILRAYWEYARLTIGTIFIILSFEKRSGYVIKKEV